MSRKIDSREHTSDRRAYRQVKRLFLIAGLIEVEGACTVSEVVDLYQIRIGDKVSGRQIRRDILLLAELGVIEEEVRRKTGPGSKIQFRYKFEGWPIAIH